MNQFFSRRSKLILSVGFVLTLIATAPAREVISAIGLDRFGVYLSGTSGVWHKGKSESLEIQLPQFAVRINSAQWDLSIWRLLLGQVAADINGEFAGKPVQFFFVQSLFGQTQLRNLSLELGSRELQPLLRSLIVPLRVDLQAQNINLIYKDGWFKAASGKLQLRNVSASMPAATINAGSALLNLSMSETSSESGAPLRLTIESYQGAYGLSGNAEILPNREYGLNLASEPDGTIEPMILQQMGLIFGPPKQGKYRFDYGSAF
ncbi:MAG: type II secretion system protein N [Pseudomonadales bacterium]